MNNSILVTAEQIGMNCRDKNIKSAAQSIECLELIKQHGNTIKILDAFNLGWHKRHIELTQFTFN